VIEFCARTPIEIKYPKLQEKHILKHAFLGKIPQSIIDREKSGMRVPLRFWQGKKIRAYNRKILLRENKKLTSQFFNIKEVKNLLKHPRSRQGLKAWMLTTFILTAKNLYEPES
jgi:asparagine synthase (glutamine-hydrolysing)